MDIVLQNRIINLCKSISSDKDIAKFLTKQTRKTITVEQVGNIRKEYNARPLSQKNHLKT